MDCPVRLKCGHLNIASVDCNHIYCQTYQRILGLQDGSVLDGSKIIKIEVIHNQGQTYTDEIELIYQDEKDSLHRFRLHVEDLLKLFPFANFKIRPHKKHEKMRRVKLGLKNEKVEWRPATLFPEDLHV